ncbi:MAG: heavy metal-responsive transcriptional regulator [Actinobacteria bacterium 13_2_20CM_2_71_6]|nr:MAG: heavy metal-responsive transcriptional regulator [Actinobacteria bacterium 13_2_20CM_2_71_6]
MRVGLTIAEVAAGAGVRPDTLRYYERTGLVPAPPRTTGAHRRYPPATVERLQFIRSAQRLGLRLSEIKELLAVRDTGVCPCEPAEDLLRRHLVEIDAELARLTRLRGEVAAMLAATPACADLAPVAAVPVVAVPWCPPGCGETPAAVRLGGGDDHAVRV